LQGKEKTPVLNHIKETGEITAMIQNIRVRLNKNVTGLSGTLRESVQSKTALPSEAIELTFTMLDRYRRAGATLDQIHELLNDLQTELKNNV